VLPTKLISLQILPKWKVADRQHVNLEVNFHHLNYPFHSTRLLAVLYRPKLSDYKLQGLGTVNAIYDYSNKRHKEI
jgi:hypothetical protein